MGFVFCDNYYSMGALCTRFTLVIYKIKIKQVKIPQKPPFVNLYFKFAKRNKNADPNRDELCLAKTLFIICPDKYRFTANDCLTRGDMWLDVSSVTDDDHNRQLGVQQARNSTSYFSLSNFLLYL